MLFSKVQFLKAFEPIVYISALSDIVNFFSSVQFSNSEAGISSTPLTVTSSIPVPAKLTSREVIESGNSTLFTLLISGNAFLSQIVTSALFSFEGTNITSSLPLYLSISAFTFPFLQVIL